MRALLIFEFKRFMKSKGLVMLLFATIISFALAVLLNNTLSKDNDPIVNYYVVISQFSLLIFLPLVSLNSVSYDVEKKTFFFYRQNKISLKILYFSKNVIVSAISFFVYFVSFVFYFALYGTISAQYFYIFIYMLFVILYSVQILFFLSIFFKNTFHCMICGVAAWISIHILGLAVKDVHFLSGKISIIDGNSYYADFVLNFEKGGINSFDDFMKGVILGITWIIIYFVLGYLISLTNKMVENVH